MTKPILSSTTDPLLTTRETAQRLGVSLRTIQLWVEAGKLQAARTPGGHRRIRASDVRALQEQMGIKQPKAAVLLTDEQVAKALADAGLKPEDYREDGQIMPLVRAIEAAVLAANGLGADHA